MPHSRHVKFIKNRSTYSSKINTELSTFSILNVYFFVFFGLALFYTKATVGILTCTVAINKFICYPGSPATDPEPSPSFIASENCTPADRNKVLEEEVRHLEDTLARYEEVTHEIISKQSEVIQLYEDIVGSANLLGGIVSLLKRQEIKKEVFKKRVV